MTNMKMMKKIILLATLILLIISPAMAVPIAPLPDSNVSVIMNFDTANGTYTKYIFGTMLTDGNITSPIDIAYGTIKPWGDAWVNVSGYTDSWYFIIMIVWTLFLMMIMISTGNTTLPLIAGIGTASGAAIVIPSLVIPVFTMFFALCAGAIFYKLWVDK